MSAQFIVHTNTVISSEFVVPKELLWKGQGNRVAKMLILINNLFNLFLSALQLCSVQFPLLIFHEHNVGRAGTCCHIRSSHPDTVCPWSFASSFNVVKLLCYSISSRVVSVAGGPSAAWDKGSSIHKIRKFKHLLYSGRMIIRLLSGPTTPKTFGSNALLSYMLPDWF